MYCQLVRNIFKLKKCVLIVIIAFLSLFVIIPQLHLTSKYILKPSTNLHHFTPFKTVNVTVDRFTSLRNVTHLTKLSVTTTSFRNVTQPTKLSVTTTKKFYVPYNYVMPESERLLNGESNSNLALLYESKWWSFSKKTVWNASGIVSCNSPPLRPNLILFSNIYWQQFTIKDNFNIYLYNAYYDNRESLAKVRIIAVTNDQNSAEKLNLWCLLWFDNNRKPLLSKVIKVYAIWPQSWKWGRKKENYGALLITCAIPNQVKHLVPQAVALTKSNSCNNLKLTHCVRVIYNKPAVRQEFGVCVQALRFSSLDYSVRLVEWLEILKTLGAHKIFFYKLAANSNMKKVLNYYSEQGFVDVRDLTLAGPQLNTPQLYQWYHQSKSIRFQPQELVELNDCLYRNLYSYRYLAILDVDEIIVPKTAYNWSQLMKQIQSSINNKKAMQKYGFYDNINTYFYRDVLTDQMTVANKKVAIPSYMYTMTHVHRTNMSKRGVTAKCFHVVANVEAVHNHFPIKCLDREYRCSGHRISTNHSYMIHFKQSIIKPNCTKKEIKQCAISDTVMWKYFNRLSVAMKRVITQIFN